MTPCNVAGPVQQRSRLGLAAICVSLAVLAGCSGGAGTSGAASATATSPASATPSVAAAATATVPVTPTPTAIVPATEDQTVSLQCTGSTITAVTIVRSGDDAMVRWVGERPQGRETVGLYVNTFDASGNSGRQLGLKYILGQPTMFIFDMSTNLNHDLNAAGANPSALTFPGAFVGYPGDFHANGAVTQDGADIGECK